jgi:hypothetical protein
MVNDLVLECNGLSGGWSAPTNGESGGGAMF